MVLTLKEALEDDETLHRLVNHPRGFVFHEAVHLTVGIKHSPPDAEVVDDANGGFIASGPSADVMKLISQTMNFTYTLVESKEWGGQTPNGSWTGLVGLMANEEADIVTSNVCQSEARNQVVDYSRAITFVQGQLLVASGFPTIDPWGFANPFKANLWAGFFISLAILWATSVVMDCAGYTSSAESPFRIFFRYLRICFNQYIHNHKQPTWKKSLTGSWFILVAVLSWSYNCSLISLLATRVITRPIQSLEDLLQDPKMGLIVEKDTIFSGFLDRAKSGSLLEARKLESKGRLIFLPNEDIAWGVQNLVLKSSHVLFINHARIAMILVEDFSKKAECNYYVARDPIMYFNCGMIVKKGNPILPAIDYRLGMLENSGIFNYWMQKKMVNATTCAHAPTKITVREAFALSSIWGMLVVWLSGMILATVTFLIELIV